MACELHHYTDRLPVSLLPPALKQQMQNLYLLSNDEKRVSFCGVVMADDGAHVFLPRNSDIPDKGSRAGFRVASALMKAIRRYSEDRSSKLYAHDEGDGSIGSRRLGLISDLLEDYCNNGLYSQRLSERVMNMGKPDWRRTISREVPFPGKGGPVYLDVHGTRRRYVSDCEIARIHASVIRELDAAYGWMVTGSDASVALDILNVPPPKGKVAAQLRAIDSELISVYSERDIRLLKLLGEYLRCEHGNKETSSAVIGMRHFHGMWEHMLDKSLLWNFPVNRLLSVPAYRFDDGSIKVAASKGQRTDTVLRLPGSDTFAVVDAKYYGAQGLDSAPGWPDLVKQFFYAKALQVYCPGASVSNAFVFPGKGPLTSAHMLNRSTKETEDASYPPIKCLYLDPAELVEHYITGKKLHTFSKELFAG
ncbi:LlaJI family restriction endonuclease [Photobacterium sp. BZF1]|uniref:LlaJI family restriction endonuclease n=1 Tax=Photobacterium sp. BZF1 TaxID=1904457 RepID=UPI001653C548|nr:LlaJI family restriction endonuclease [Photobacterium sp. BZF1]MBC7003525.1 LlaJI family restriction endonuclease [Photobacterium sp. BZF1]